VILVEARFPVAGLFGGFVGDAVQLLLLFLLLGLYWSLNFIGINWLRRQVDVFIRHWNLLLVYVTTISLWSGPKLFNPAQWPGRRLSCPYTSLPLILPRQKFEKEGDMGREYGREM